MAETSKVGQIIKMMLKALLLSGLWSLASSSVAYGSRGAVTFAPCASTGMGGSALLNTKDRELLDASGLKLFSIRVHDSSVQVEGIKGLTHIELIVVGCASSPRMLKTLRYQFSVGGPETALTVRKTPAFYFLRIFHHKRYAYFQMHVRVPESLAVKVNSDSGNIAAENLTTLTAKSDSGDITVSHILGLFNVQSDSGDIYAQNLGTVKVIKARSGDVQLLKVAGNVVAGSLGSGTLTIQTVHGNVAIQSVRTGTVRITQVEGNVALDKAGTGTVQVNTVGGSFIVRHAGDGEIRYSNVKGVVSVPRSNA